MTSSDRANTLLHGLTLDNEKDWAAAAHYNVHRPQQHPLKQQRLTEQATLSTLPLQSSQKRQALSLETDLWSLGVGVRGRASPQHGPESLRGMFSVFITLEVTVPPQNAQKKSMLHCMCMVLNLKTNPLWRWGNLRGWLSLSVCSQRMLVSACHTVSYHDAFLCNKVP